MEKVVVIMGSKSDQEKVEPAVKLLVEEFGIETGVYCISAHRAHDGLIAFVDDVNLDNDTLVIIAAAGLSAALPGVIASKTTIPVIGLPLSDALLKGHEALLSMAEMPPGVPVATVGIDAAKNAGLMAARIVANHDEKVKQALEEYNFDMCAKSLHTNEEIHEEFLQKYSKKSP